MLASLGLQSIVWQFDITNVCLNFYFHIQEFNLFVLLFFSTPAYDWAPNPDKQWILQVTDRMESVHKKFTDILMTKRLQTLQSVDEGIERVC